MSQQRLICLNFIFLAVILTLCLYPKEQSVENDAQWRASKNGLQFNGNGIAYVDDISHKWNKNQTNELSIEIIISPKTITRKGYKPILTVHGGNDLEQITLWQWGNSIIVLNDNDFDYSKKSPRITASSILKPGTQCRITVISSKNGVCLYHNGNLIKKKKSWNLKFPEGKTNLRLTLGNSVYGKHGWEGTIHYVSIYSRALNQDEVQNIPDSNQLHNELFPKQNNGLILAYTFAANNKPVIEDLSDNNVPLIIPTTLTILQKQFLVAPWTNFHPNKVFFIDAVLNFMGFIPLAMTLFLWLRRTNLLPHTPVVLTVITLCFVLSLGIETIQVWLPSRNSDLLDLTLNTLGACAGIQITTILPRYSSGKSETDMEQ